MSHVPYPDGDQETTARPTTYSSHDQQTAVLQRRKKTSTVSMTTPAALLDGRPGIKLLMAYITYISMSSVHWCRSDIVCIKNTAAASTLTEPAPMLT